MDLRIFIGVSTQLLLIHQSDLQRLWFGSNVNLPLPYSQERLIYPNAPNPVSFLHLSQQNAAQNNPSDSKMLYKDRLQQIFSLPDNFRNFKTLTSTQNLSPHYMIGQYLPGGYKLMLPNYNQIPALYFRPSHEILFPQYRLQKDGSLVPNYYTIPSAGNLDGTPFNQPNQYQNNIIIPNNEISSSDDELYKVTLNSYASTEGEEPIPNASNSSPMKIFKTNFGGDLSKCDMICKCRNIYKANNTSIEDNGSSTAKTNQTT